MPTEKTFGGYITSTCQGFKRNTKSRTNSPKYPFLSLIQQIQVLIKSTRPDMTTVFYAWSIKVDLPRWRAVSKEVKVVERIKALIFLETLLAKENVQETQSNLEEIT